MMKDPILKSAGPNLLATLQSKISSLNLRERLNWHSQSAQPLYHNSYC